mmetsp:Transcript_99312/g.138008  ORF Transcript_99312/g.138008 Transcript_99312/m.138008 type:complete len:89 (+) Transcript_99312:60-326(+)
MATSKRGVNLAVGACDRIDMGKAVVSSPLVVMYVLSCSRGVEDACASMRSFPSAIEHTSEQRSESFDSSCPIPRLGKGKPHAQPYIVA